MQKRLCGREQEYGLKSIPTFSGSARPIEMPSHFYEGCSSMPSPLERWRTEVAEGIIQALGALNRGHSFQGGGMSRRWFGNGSMVYVDYSSTLEMANAEGLAGSYDSILQEKASELLLSEAAEVFRRDLESRPLTPSDSLMPLKSLSLYKNNTGPKIGQDQSKDFFREATYGSHQNYSYLRSKHEAVVNIFADLLPALLPITGSGHIFRSRFGDFYFLLSSRANHIEDRVSATTTTVNDTRSKRALVNTRGGINPGAENLMEDASGLCRFHIISRDATRCEFQTWLVDMITHLVLRLAEEGDPWPQRYRLRDPVKEMQRLNFLFLNISDVWQYHLTCGTTLGQSGRIDLFDYNYLFLNAAKQLSPLSDQEKKALQEWERVLELLKARAFDELVGELDWVTKRNVIQKAMVRKGWGLDSVSAWKMDAEYHNISPDPRKSLFAWLDEQGHIRHLVTPEEISRARFVAPNTRAKSRGDFIRWCANNPELAQNVKDIQWGHFNYKNGEIKYYFGESANPFSAQSSDVQKLFRQLGENS